MKKKNKEEIIMDLSDIMIELQLDKSFIKNVTQSLEEKAFGKESEEYKRICEIMVEKIKQAQYTSKNLKN